MTGVHYMNLVNPYNNMERSSGRIMSEGKFWKKVSKDTFVTSKFVNTPCWPWRGTIHKATGYGLVKWNYEQMKAHRVAWMLTNGEIPDGLLVCHSCDNKWCVNPDHLFIGDNTTNQADLVSKGLQKKGSNHGMARITEADVIAIRDLACNETDLAIATRLGVEENTVRLARAGINWTYLNDLYPPKVKIVPTNPTQSLSEFL